MSEGGGEGVSTHQKTQCRAPESPNPASRKKQESRAQNFPAAMDKEARFGGQGEMREREAG